MVAHWAHCRLISFKLGRKIREGSKISVKGSCILLLSWQIMTLLVVDTASMITSVSMCVECGDAVKVRSSASKLLDIPAQKDPYGGRESLRHSCGDAVLCLWHVVTCHLLWECPDLQKVSETSKATLLKRLHLLKGTGALLNSHLALFVSVEPTWVQIRSKLELKRGCVKRYVPINGLQLNAEYSACSHLMNSFI